MKKIFIIFFFLSTGNFVYGQDDLLSAIPADSLKQKEPVVNAFKSSRVINGHSIEFIGKNVLDFRILHRFGLVNSGISDMFGLDDASIRLGLDYGLARDLTIGVGRSSVGKEIDGFIKYRLVQQATGVNASPVSILLVTGSSIGTLKRIDKTIPQPKAFWGQVLVGRKFSERFSLQLSPTYVYRSQVPIPSDEKNTYALGVGSRFKITRRLALVGDYHYVVSGLDKNRFRNPLSLGIDIETGGHVFQLHFSNATGMNEKAFITNTTDDWSSGGVRFGFNISRVFDFSKQK